MPIVEDQSAVIALLDDPATHGGAPVERIATHASLVFLAGTRVYKLKRAVRYPYLDYGAVALRRQACLDEVRLNRRTAPSLYLGAAPIVRRGTALALGAPGEERDDAVDWVVVMRRFDAAGLFDLMAREGRLDVGLIERAASVIARFHQAAEKSVSGDGAANLAWVIEDNDRALGADPAFAPMTVAAITAACREALDRVRPLLDARARSGFVRACHGDLHLRNLCLMDGEPTPFDGIEFDPRLSTIDVAYDLAFLLMDLLHRDLRVHAAAALNRWVAATEDVEALALLPLFLALRALVRAKVGADAARLAGREPAESHDYHALAGRLLAPPPAVLVAIGGLSGSGKSTLARALAPDVGPAPGALVLRSDVLRKRLFGVAETERLPVAAYGDAATDRVYGELRADAARALATGHGVIVDAVHARTEERVAIEAVAHAARARFVGLWLDAPATTLIARVASRARDASDADAAVARAQQGYDVGPMGWTRIEAGGGPERTLARATGIVGGATVGSRP